jgi:hypothetical protein
LAKVRGCTVVDIDIAEIIFLGYNFVSTHNFLWTVLRKFFFFKFKPSIIFSRPADKRTHAPIIPELVPFR